MNFALVLLIPIIISVISFIIYNEINWKELLLQLGVCTLVLVVSWQISKWVGLSDIENLNGRITKKIEGTESCCHCWTECLSRDKKGNCTRSVKKCSHNRDYYWKLGTSVGTISIESCSGDNNPPSVWINAKIGEPASIEHSYQNYLLADPNSLFVHHDEHRVSLPKYPRVSGTYTVNHIVSDGILIPNGMQEALREINADLGSRNQVDITLFLTNKTNPEFAQKVESGWLYGPKNSITIVVGIGNGNVIDWIRIVTFSKVEELKVKLRDELQGKKLNDPEVLTIIRTNVSKLFRRTAMKEFEYLASAAEPRGTGLIIISIIQLLLSIGLSYYMHMNDLFETSNNIWKRKEIY